MMKDKKSEQVMNIYLKGLEQDHIFQPGETIAGVVEINANEVISCRNIVVTIGWHTEGRGDRNGEDIYRDELNVTEIVPGNPMTHHFETTLPSGPWSHAGKLISYCLGSSCQSRYSMGAGTSTVPCTLR